MKVTGGQRIDMLGVKKEDLPAVWADLGKAGFVSGHAYAKGLRTVKTCVGTDWCRFGTQDSTGFGIRIEKFMWGSWTPAKVKMAVSGCPRNCAEATCKDVGVVCVDSGYEIHFAGAAGLDIKGTEVLGLVKTEDEALEVIVALVQMYREQARYLERIYKWTKRVGVAEIRRQVARRSREAQSLLRSLRLFAEIRTGRSLVGARIRHAQARIPADGDGRPGASSGVSAMRWIPIGSMSDIPQRGARCVETPIGRIAMFRTAEDRVFALDDHCPHKGGPLSQGIVHGAAVTCPLHNWVISLETGKALGRRRRSVRTIPIKIDGDKLFIALETSREPAA